MSHCIYLACIAYFSCYLPSSHYTSTVCVQQWCSSYVILCLLLQYSDNYYRAALIEAIAATVTPAITTVSVTGSVVYFFLFSVWLWCCHMLLGQSFISSCFLCDYGVVICYWVGRLFLPIFCVIMVLSLSEFLMCSLVQCAHWLHSC